MYAIDKTGRNPIFQVNQHIGFDDDIKNEKGEVIEKGEGQGIDGKDFSKEFFEADLNNPESITTYINTMGGHVQPALDMFNAISRAKSKTKNIISGFAYSSGGWIALAADEVEMVCYGSWMCHLPYNPIEGEEETKPSPFLDAVANTIATIISSKSGKNGKPKKTVDEIKELMKNKTYLNAKQMYDEGFINRITDANGKPIELTEFLSEIPFYNFQDSKIIKSIYREKQVALNKFFNQPKEEKPQYNMKKVVNRLNEVKVSNMKFSLAQDSPEEDVVNSISRMENRINELDIERETNLKAINKLQADLKAANDNKEELQAKMDKMQSSANSMDEEIANMKSKMENMEATNKQIQEEKKAAEQAAKLEKATNLIVENISNGKIRGNKDEMEAIKSGWIQDAVENYDKVKRHLDSIYVGFRLPTPVLNSEDDSRPDGGTGSIKDFMAVNRAEREQRIKAHREKEERMSLR